MSIDGDCQWPKFDLISNKQKKYAQRGQSIEFNMKKKHSVPKQNIGQMHQKEKNSSFIHMETRVSERNGKNIVFHLTIIIESNRCCF